MGEATPDYSWLPKHQEHVAYTLAHVDSLIERIGGVLWDYLDAGPFEFANVDRGDESQVLITGVRPLPEEISRLFADTTTELRGAIEHSIFAEVEYELGHTLDELDLDARAVEMPATTTADQFVNWLKPLRRRSIQPLNDGGELISRIRTLQPYWAVDPESHPLKVLAEHTNFAKHRAPAVAAARVAHVSIDFELGGIDTEKVGGEAPRALAGDIIATGPRGVKAPISVWPEIGVQRPHTGAWHIVMHELNGLSEWVRTEAIPRLITGQTSVDPLPPQLNISIGYANFQEALQEAGLDTAFHRNSIKLQAHMGREGLPGILSTYGQVALVIAEQWVESLDDQTVVDRITGLAAVSGQILEDRVRGMVREASALHGK